jgi:hypothetical protein
MNKKTTAAPADDNLWDAPLQDETPVVQQPKSEPEVKKVIAQPIKPAVQFDLEGLMTDFPTAKDLERFVYDETGIVLNLKGRANKLKYQVAMDVLNGEEVDPVFLGTENPYVDKAEMVPVEDLKPVPARDRTLPTEEHIQNQFYTPFIPHPDEELRAQNKKCHTVFRKYKNGVISYEVLGPVDTRPYGEKIDKFGRTRPEVIKWIDPRTGEQTVVRADGTLTPMGRNLKALMQKFRVNNSNAWQIWIDRDFVNMEGGSLRNPWDTDSI